ncbi:MAG: hypothetical protein ACOYI4_03750 [Christensenellales bacterium]|jgi:hypothetical protein
MAINWDEKKITDWEGKDFESIVGDSMIAPGIDNKRRFDLPLKDILAAKFNALVETLKGMVPGDIGALPATGKAADSDKLDGLHATDLCVAGAVTCPANHSTTVPLGFRPAAVIARAADGTVLIAAGSVNPDPSGNLAIHSEGFNIKITVAGTANYVAWRTV